MVDISTVLCNRARLAVDGPVFQVKDHNARIRISVLMVVEEGMLQPRTTIHGALLTDRLTVWFLFDAVP